MPPLTNQINIVSTKSSKCSKQLRSTILCFAVQHYKVNCAYNDKFYKQINRHTMNSLLIAYLANLYMYNLDLDEIVGQHRISYKI